MNSISNKQMRRDAEPWPNLRPAGRRLTRQRRIILEALRGVVSHPSAEAIHRMVRRRLPRVSYGTVYRNLGVLQQQGLIQELRYGKARSRYDGNPAAHYHATCGRCGRVDDVPMMLAAALNRAAGAASHYRVAGHRLEFYGVCPACRARDKRSIGAGGRAHPADIAGVEHGSKG